MSFSKDKNEKFCRCPKCFSETKHKKLRDDELVFGELLNKDYMDITVLEALIYELQRLEYNTEFKEENNNLVCNFKGKVR